MSSQLPSLTAAAASNKNNHQEPTTPLPNHLKRIGTSPDSKLPGHYHLVFANINGISLSNASMAEFLHQTMSFRADWVVLAETHLDSNKSHVRDRFLSFLRSPRTYSCVKVTHATSDLNYGEDRKMGGVLQFATGTLATRLIASHTDIYGRFTSHSYTGQRCIFFLL